MLVRNADRKSVLYTDESRLYVETGEEYAKHDTVKHSPKGYARFKKGGDGAGGFAAATA